MTPVMNVLVPQFEQQTGHKVQSPIMTARQLPQRLAAGDRGEMAIAALSDIDQFIKDGFLRASSRAILGSVGIALVVREGAPKLVHVDALSETPNSAPLSSWRFRSRHETRIKWMLVYGSRAMNHLDVGSSF